MRKKLGRPEKLEKWKDNLPSNRLRELSGELAGNLEFQLEFALRHEELSQRGSDVSSEEWSEYCDAMQQCSSRLDEVMAVIMQLHAAMLLSHDRPFRLLPERR